ncbi:ribokinase [Aquirufa sp. OSTEICH-129V]|uniref:Ribokinase n=1 Tax=Aquirufa avitistagni TaxID=3104728 RepID=A0ABW6DH98_9BACT
MSKIIVIGSSNTDMVIVSDRLPKPGETILGGQFLLNPGGKGANQAVAAAKLGGETHFVCKVGNDVFGEMARKQFIETGIHCEFVQTDFENPSGVALINVDAHGENCITVASGANGSLSKADIDNASILFEKENILLIQLEIPLASVWYAVEKAANAGMKVILNPAPAAQIPDHIYPHLFAITPNETEIELLTGITVTHLDDAKKAAKKLIEKGVPHVFITLGAQGAYYQSAHDELFVPTQAVKAVDTTAAGDCFNGALAVALSKQKTWLDAITFSCRAATYSVMHAGAQASMPKLSDL